MKDYITKTIIPYIESKESYINKCHDKDFTIALNQETKQFTSFKKYSESELDRMVFDVKDERQQRMMIAYYYLKFFKSNLSKNGFILETQIENADSSFTFNIVLDPNDPILRNEKNINIKLLGKSSKTSCFSVYSKYLSKRAIILSNFKIKNITHYVETISRMMKIADEYNPIKVIVPSISLVLKDVISEYSINSIDQKNSEIVYIKKLLENPKKYEKYFKIRDKFVYFMDIANKFLSDEIIENNKDKIEDIKDIIKKSLLYILDDEKFSLQFRRKYNDKKEEEKIQNIREKMECIFKEYSKIIKSKQFFKNLDNEKISELFINQIIKIKFKITELSLPIKSNLKEKTEKLNPYLQTMLLPLNEIFLEEKVEKIDKLPDSVIYGINLILNQTEFNEFFDLKEIEDSEINDKIDFMRSEISNLFKKKDFILNNFIQFVNEYETKKTSGKIINKHIQNIFDLWGHAIKTKIPIGDFKPSNLFLDESENIGLIDVAETAVLYNAGEYVKKVRGTIAYCSFAQLCTDETLERLFGMCTEDFRHIDDGVSLFLTVCSLISFKIPFIDNPFLKNIYEEFCVKQFTDIQEAEKIFKFNSSDFWKSIRTEFNLFFNKNNNKNIWENFKITINSDMKNFLLRLSYTQIQMYNKYIKEFKIINKEKFINKKFEDIIKFKLSVQNQKEENIIIEGEKISKNNSKKTAYFFHALEKTIFYKVFVKKLEKKEINVYSFLNYLLYFFTDFSQRYEWKLMKKNVNSLYDSNKKD